MDWDNFEVGLETAFEDMSTRKCALDRSCKTYDKLPAYHQYTKIFRTVVLELGSKALDNGA